MKFFPVHIAGLCSSAPRIHVAADAIGPWMTNLNRHPAQLPCPSTQRRRRSTIGWKWRRQSEGAYAKLRKMQSLSQRELAHRLNVPRTYLSKVETCKVLPTIGTLYRLAAALSVQVHHLLLTRETVESSQDPFLVEIAPMIQSLTPEQRVVILRTVRDIALRRKHAA